MQSSKNVNHWLAGTVATFSTISLSDAAVVRVNLNHDLSTTLDGVDFGLA